MVHVLHQPVLHYTAGIISYEERAYAIVEGRTVEVCLSPITEELEVNIISVKDGSATEGSPCIYTVLLGVELQLYMLFTGFVH